MDLYTAIGLGGVAFYVSSYALVQVSKMDGNGVVYSAMNVIAASMVLVSLFKDFNLASMVTQVTWICIGVGGLSLRARGGLRSEETVLPIESAHAESAHAVHDIPRASPKPPPVDERANTGAGAGTLLRVRPNLGVPGTPSPVTLNLRPDTAPALTGRRAIGLRPDVAPIS